MTAHPDQASFAQHGMWLTRAPDTTAAHHLPVLIRLDDGSAPLDTAALAKAVDAVVARHPLLATALEDRDGVAHLVPCAPPVLRVAVPGEEPAAEIAAPFDPAEGPLIRFVLFPGLLVVTAHHLVFDGLSKELLVADLAAALDGSLGPAPAVTFGQAAEDQRVRVAELLTEAGAFWGPRFAEPGPVVVAGTVLTSRAAGPGGVVEFAAPVPSLDGLTRFETVLAAVHAVLFQAGNGTVTTAVDLSTRRAEHAEVIGPFVNELPVGSRPVAGTPFAEFAAGVRAGLREVYPYREVPLARAVPGVRPHAALAPVSVSYRTRPQLSWPGGRVEWLASNGAVRGELQLQLVDDGERISASLRHSPHAAAAAHWFAGALTRILAEIAADPSAPIGTAAVAHAAPAARAAASGAAGDADLVAAMRPIWEEVLEISPIGPDDDLFDLGAHSLTITRIIARMQQHLGIDIDIDAFFDAPTLNGVADAVRAR